MKNIYDQIELRLIESAIHEKEASVQSWNSSTKFCSCWSNIIVEGSGCGSVGRAVASDTRGPRFEWTHRRNLIQYQLYRKDEKKKRPGKAHA